MKIHPEDPRVSYPPQSACEPLRFLPGGPHFGKPLVRRISRSLTESAQAVDYSAAFDRSERRVARLRQALERERAEAPRLVAELLAGGAGRRERMLLNPPRLQTWGTAELLVERSRDESGADPERGEELGLLAVRLAQSLDADLYGSERLEDLRAEAWGYVANARRRCSDLPGATAAFREAFAHLARGTGDPLERAVLLDLEASLLRSRCLHKRALRHLEQALSIFVEAGEKHRAGRVLLKMDSVHQRAGQPELGIPLLYRALDLIDPAREPRLLLYAWHSLIDDLIAAGRLMEAQGLYGRARALSLRFPEPGTENRRKWLDGKLARRLGHAERAEELLLAARAGFAARGVPYERALVSLDLASLYTEQGRSDELDRLEAEMVPLLSQSRAEKHAAALAAGFRAAEA
ncbi:MAG TPA: hypothetical protein VGE98_09655 [Thermoanaerobaculia bacterium]